MNLRDKINSLLDDTVEYLINVEPDNQPLFEIFSAYTFSHQYHNVNSKFFGKHDLLDKSWNYLLSSKTRWDEIIRKKANHTRDVVMWVMSNYLRITPELSAEQKEIIKKYVISVADEATSYSSRSLIFLDIPNHAILRTLACEYAHSTTGKAFYHKKALKIRNYVLHKFVDGIAPELSLNYTPFNVILLSHLYEHTKDDRILEYIRKTADIIPVFIYNKTGDVIGIDNREMIKTVSLAPYGALCASMVMAANLLNDPKYLSVAQPAVEYIERYTTNGLCEPFPRWECNPEITDTTKVIELMSKDTTTAIISYYLALSDYYFSTDLDYKEFPDVNIETQNIRVIKKIIGEAEAVISNVYPSPVVYVTPKTSLIGWVPSEEVYRKTKMSYCEASKNYLYVYSHPTKSHSTAFFHGDYIIWIHTIEKNKHSNLYWSGFIFIDHSKDVLCKKGSDVIERKIDCYTYPLDWVLLPLNKEKYIGVAIFGDARLAINKGIQIIYKKDGFPTGDSSSILLIGEWNRGAKEWQDFLDQWSLSTKSRNFFIKTPEGNEYKIKHRNHYIIKRTFYKNTDRYRKFKVYF